MTDFRSLLASLRRPRLLMRAAHCGMADYNRDRDLRRLVDGAMTPDELVPRLAAEEQRLEGIRTSGAATYPVGRHVEVLVALIAEVQLAARIGASA